MRVFFFIMIVSVLDALTLTPHTIASPSVLDASKKGVKILDSKILDIAEIQNIPFFGISDISYDKKRDVFYALSDRAKLFTLSIMIKDKKIQSIKALSGSTLKDKKQRDLWGKYKDSEGLALVDEVLFIAYERVPRVMQYDRALHEKSSVKLPVPLADMRYYQGRNDALESLTFSPRYGLLTTSEYPLRNTARGYHDIYSLKGKLCAMKRVAKKMAITEIESMPDGNLLVLQRRFDFKTFSFQIALTKVFLQKKNAGVCESRLLLWMDSKEGWDIDNFEGLTHYKDNLYIMITDDNNNPFESTIVTLFELKE